MYTGATLRDIFGPPVAGVATVFLFTLTKMMAMDPFSKTMVVNTVVFFGLSCLATHSLLCEVRSVLNKKKEN